MALGKGLNSLIPQNRSRKIIRKETSIGGVKDQVWQIPLSDIVPNQEQPRKHFAHQELEDLVASIKIHGILQPILVTEKEDGGYELIAGERRFRSAQIVGLPTIPAIVRSVSRQEKLEFALIENIQRQNLNPIEEAFAYKRLIEEFGLQQDDVAQRVGKARSTVANTLRLLDLPAQVQKALVDGNISAGKARALLSLKEPQEQIAVFHEMIGSAASVRDVEQRVASKGQISRKGSVRKDPNVTAQEQILQDRLGTKVHITRKGERGAITIEYYSLEEFKRLMEELS